MTRTATRAAHLAKRFFGSLVPFGASSADEAWGRTVLSPGELALWSQMSRPDLAGASWLSAGASCGGL